MAYVNKYTHIFWYANIDTKLYVNLLCVHRRKYLFMNSLLPHITQPYKGLSSVI